MNLSALRPLLGVFTALGAGTLSVPAQPSEYVSRSEYDQLKRDFDQLKLRLDGLAPGRTVVSSRAPLGVAETSPAASTVTNRPPSFLSDFQPGWERFRGSDWSGMDHSRRDEMNARIATGESFSLFAG